MTPGSGIEPGTHWWEASALTTAPTLKAAPRANPCFYGVWDVGIARGTEWDTGF